ncbi:PREDICTED: outer dense fiber protein 3-B-like [Dufourea novaeangliae]|uniref:Outer dense fiber protein 3 n=1 Tax=Dufourea novaeangliae TaxID=178035 RepID=A0A154PJM7_DUFNO|nr:PREDICTED: outer dense fiber protein 3-B-like [Dufourea novaeangliae]KZC12069.1 Outer dense fiber protein 3 [Dufourea novaeangliae]
MENKENKGKLLSCMIKGPGPVYKLRTVVGYEGHCLSRHRNPAYTMRCRAKLTMPRGGPGPQYNVSKLTNYGEDKSPAFTISGREVYRIRDSGPGPGAHYPELCLPMNHSLRPPAYSLKSRGQTKIGDSGPGPNAYSLPTCIGPKIPDKTAQGAFTIGGYHKLRHDHIGPGPAHYGDIKIDVSKRRFPAFSLKWRNPLTQIDFSPGPRYYPQFNTGKKSAMYSFGIRHSECAGVPITDLDEE